MEQIYDILIFVGMAAVALVLFAGLLNMFRNGPANRSQKLMRWRVGLKLLVIVLVLCLLYFFGKD